MAKGAIWVGGSQALIFIELTSIASRELLYI